MRHSVELGRVLRLGDRCTPSQLNRFHSQTAIRGRTREDNPDCIALLIKSQALKKIINRHMLTTLIDPGYQVQYALPQSHSELGGHDINMIRLER